MYVTNVRPARKIVPTLLMLLPVAMFAYPALLTLTTSIRTQQAILDSPLGLPDSISFEAYVDAWTSVGFGRLLLNSTLYAVLGSGIALVIAAIPAYAFSRFRIWGGKTIFIMILTTLMLPPQTVLIPLYQLLGDLGLLNSKLGLILIYGIYSFPFMMLLLTGFMAAIPRELEESARVDGCSDLAILRHVILPLSMPAIAISFTLNFVWVWKEFIFALTFVTTAAHQPVTVGLVQFTTAQYFTAFNLPAAAVVMSQIPMVIMFLIAYRWVRQGLYVGAVKG